ncbi:MAG: cob(I)yrinic acid a,c-diamide adenosyltransferase [Clostridiales bacterium]|nr:cob(I)yrinic acid a,c-diamide adenosyltransferase [Clostridiales bacterium]
MEQGFVHLYCGEGKGKTTAGMGLCLRALGHGLRVGIAQFLKDGSSGEIAAWSRLRDAGCPVLLFPAASSVKFVFHMNAQERQEAAAFILRLLGQTRDMYEDLDVLLLDEALTAVETGLLTEESLLDLIRGRPSGLELVLTGRRPTPALLETADYISEIRSVRHPFEQGTAARQGIEY